MTGFYGRRGKRAFDLALATSALIVTAPVQGVVAIVIRRKMGRPILFRQKRPGFVGREFTMLKFRTMKQNRSDGLPETDAERLTPLGRFLRSSSLDELPEFWNVLWGDMSVIGPRPLRMEYLPRYSEVQARRHDVRPGITGWAQVNGRNSIPWDERFALDVWYVDNMSFGLDIRILWRTIREVLRRSGISAAGHETMPEFKPES